MSPANGNPSMKPVEGFPGYFVTSDGKVFSTKKQFGTEFRELKQFKNGTHEIMSVNLYVPGGAKIKAVHRLVAEAYLPPPKDTDNCVRHLDDDVSNNDVSNLAWGNHADNYFDWVRNEERRKSQKSSLRS